MPMQLRQQGERLKHSPRASAQRDQLASLGRSCLPAELKTGIESLSGLSMDGVQVQYNSAKPAQLNALAYAQGNHIHVAPGQERHLPHEAWHLVQQAQGRVRPTTQISGLPVNDDHVLEQEADAMGAKAVVQGRASGRGAAVQRLPVPLATGLATKAPRQQQQPVQRKWDQVNETIMAWDTPMGGLNWFFNQNTDKMAFKLAGDESDYPPEVLKQLGIWRPYGEWQLMGWGIEGAPETPTTMVKREDYERSFESYVQTGTRRWIDLQKAMEKGGGGGSLDRDTQAARNWFFKEHYTTGSKPGDYEGDSQIESSYKFRPESIKGMSGNGAYTNRFQPATGNIVADSNYALKSGEDYYNPEVAKPRA
ncbi:DUF4157 domain-containing protein [Paucibacter sp. O1-1]|nr:DUF4157 domain-containing protein [Paucibacter sp. O1-1]MDA3830211.1 DUF4157 domain-containing protein [Paucibacter sp. O1-1]